MLNVGPLELLVVLAVALIVVGPERLPELARSVGKALRQLRQVQDEVRDMVSMGVDEDVRRAAADVRKVAGDLTKATDVKGTARRAGRAARTEARRTLEPARRAGAPLDGPAEPDAPTAGDGSALQAPAERPAEATPEPEVAAPEMAEPEVAGPPADRLVEDRATPEPEDRTTERS